jgi:FKBP-type peptidyl-prolyl cis-trans isomerase FklB
MNHSGLTRVTATIGPYCAVRPWAWPMRNCIAVAALLCPGLWSGPWAGDAPEAVLGAQERINYSVGFEFGRYLGALKRQGTGVELEAVFRGVLDALSGAQPRMTEEEMRKQLDELASALSAVRDKTDQIPDRTAARARTHGFVDDFAALNAKRESVTTLPSGLQYEVLHAGTGRTPQTSDRVAIQYEGKLSTGVVFDSTDRDGEPMRLRVDEIVVPGLRESLLRMKEGDKWRVVVPPGLGFGRSGNNMLRKRDLIYEIELVAVEAAP